MINGQPGKWASKRASTLYCPVWEWGYTRVSKCNYWQTQKAENLYKQRVFGLFLQIPQNRTNKSIPEESLCNKMVLEMGKKTLGESGQEIGQVKTVETAQVFDRLLLFMVVFAYDVSKLLIDFI